MTGTAYRQVYATHELTSHGTSQSQRSDTDRKNTAGEGSGEHSHRQDSHTQTVRARENNRILVSRDVLVSGE